MFCCRHATFAASVLLLVSPLVAAAPEAPPTSEFKPLYREWKGTVARLAQIRERYRTASKDDLPALENEFNAKLELARSNEPKLTAAAEAAYLAAPNQDKDVSDYLSARLGSLVGADDYEPAAKLARILVDNKLDRKYLNFFAGMAFFATNDFDEAEKYLKLAEAANDIDQNGKRNLRAIDRYRQLWEREQKIRAAEEKADNLPRVKLVTSKGDIVIELFENEAPIATANFLSLVEKKFYDGLKFHRVLPGFMAQGGDPKGDGTGGPGYTIPCECYQQNHRYHFRGTLSMAHAGKDTGGSQFFLTFVPTPHLDGKHTAFGRVIEGEDVLAKLQRCQPGDAAKADTIVKATVLRKRSHKYDFIKRADAKK